MRRPGKHDPECEHESNIAMRIAISSDSQDDLLRAVDRTEEAAMHLLSGNIELVLNQETLTIGPFEGALILLPTIDSMIAALHQLRGGGPRIQIALIGDDTSLWLAQKSTKDREHVNLTYREARSSSIRVSALDAAARNAVKEFFATLDEHIPLHHWSQETTDVLKRATTLWPNLSFLQNSQRSTSRSTKRSR